MSKTYALERLLQHGAMTREGLKAVCGWTEKELDRTLSWLTDSGRVERTTLTGCARFAYRLSRSHWMPEVA